MKKENLVNYKETKVDTPNLEVEFENIVNTSDLVDQLYVEKKELEDMLCELIEEVLHSGSYYSDVPFLHDLLQNEGRIKDFRLNKGLKYSHER